MSSLASANSRQARITGLAAQWRTLSRLLRGQPKAGTHAERLNAFYAPQAENYDAFRQRLLHGREALVSIMNPAPGAHVVELGCGTGQVLDFFGESVNRLGSIELVDVCDPLLEIAHRRAARHPGVARVVRAPIEEYRPAQLVDCVYLSYSLTMAADWRRTLNNAIRMLRPGGILGVVDFYVSEVNPAPNRVRHSLLARKFWPRWFAHDGVRLDPRHLPTVSRCTSPARIIESLAPLPWIPGLRVPYYLYVGRRWQG